MSSVRLALIISKVQCSSGTSVLLRVYRIALVDCLGHRGLQKIQKRDFTGGQTDRQTVLGLIIEVFKTMVIAGVSLSPS